MDPRLSDALSGDHLLQNTANDRCYCCHRHIPPKHVVFLMPCGCGPFHSSCIKRLKRDSLRPIDQERHMSPVSIEFRCPDCGLEVQSNQHGPQQSSHKSSSRSKPAAFHTPTPPRKHPYYPQSPYYGIHSTPHSHGMPSFSPGVPQSWPPLYELPSAKFREPVNNSQPSAPPESMSGRRREKSGSILWSNSSRGSSIGSTISGAGDDTRLQLPDPHSGVPQSPRVNTGSKRKSSNARGTSGRDTGGKSHASTKEHGRRYEETDKERGRKDGKFTERNIHVTVHVCRAPGCDKCKPDEGKRRQKGSRNVPHGGNIKRRGTRGSKFI